MITPPVPPGDPASCCAAGADLAACARLLRQLAGDDPDRNELAAHLESLGAALSELGVALSSAQSLLGGGAGPARARAAAVSSLGRARARLRRVCEHICTTESEGDRGRSGHGDQQRA